MRAILREVTYKIAGWKFLTEIITEDSNTSNSDIDLQQERTMSLESIIEVARL